GEPLLVVVMNARNLPAVGLNRPLERAPAVDVRDRGAGIHCVDVLLRDPADVLLRRGKMGVRIGGARVAGDGGDQLFHAAVPISPFPCTGPSSFAGAASTIASNTDIPCKTSSSGTG